MVDGQALQQIFSLESAAWSAVGLLFLFVIRLWNGSPAMFAQWIAYRRARAEEKAADWLRLREEIGRLAEAEERCRKDFRALHAEHMRVLERIASLEGYMAGQGQARNEAAGVVAMERLAQRKGDEPNRR